MIDLAASLAFFALAALVGLAFGVRALLLGAVNYARVDRDGGGPLLPASSMRAGYWALQPVGALLARLRVTPDAITLTALALGLGAAAAAATGHLGVAAALLTLSSLGDALDGMVARATGVASRAGEVLDATADRYQEFAFLAGLAILLRGDARLLGLAAVDRGVRGAVDHVREWLGRRERAHHARVGHVDRHIGQAPKGAVAAPDARLAAAWADADERAADVGAKA